MTPISHIFMFLYNDQTERWEWTKNPRHIVPRRLPAARIRHISHSININQNKRQQYGAEFYLPADWIRIGISWRMREQKKKLQHQVECAAQSASGLIHVPLIFSSIYERINCQKPRTDSCRIMFHWLSKSPKKPKTLSPNFFGKAHGKNAEGITINGSDWRWNNSSQRDDVINITSELIKIIRLIKQLSDNYSFNLLSMSG